MRTIWLKRDYREATGGLEGQFPHPSHVRQTVKENTKVVAPDGTIIAVLLCHGIPPARHKLAYELWKMVDELPSNRATAVGSASLPRNRKDGTLSERRGVPRTVLSVLEEQGVRQGTLGYLDATPDQPCHKTRLAIRHPELLDGNRSLIELVDALYKKHLPTFYAKQRAEVENVPRWRLWQTVFSTI